MTPPGINRARLHSLHCSDKMRESKKRKMVKTGRMPGPMEKRRRRDEILQKICSVRHLPAAPPPVLSSHQMNSSKKRKMALTVRMMGPTAKRHRHHRQEEVQLQQNTRSSVLPDDLIFEIMVRLPVRTVGKLRCVCKSWLSIAGTPSFVKAHVERNRFARQTLIIADPGSCTEPHSKAGLYDADLTAGIHLRELPPLELLNPNSLLTSCDGLVLFWCLPMKRHCVINPLTGHFRVLPRIICNFDGFLGFYFHRHSSEYRILASIDSDISYVNTVGKSNWRRIRDRRPALLKNFNSVDVGGSLYWLAWKEPPDEDDEFPDKAPPDTVMAFDEEAEVYSFLPLPPSEELRDRGGNLMDFNGELGLWFISDDGIIDFWIMKESWIKRYSVFHPDLELFPKNFSYIQSEVWQFGSAVSVRGEELLIGAFRPLEEQFLIRWNLKTGACLVENVEDYAQNLLLQFPYIEALTLPGHSLA